MYSPKIKEDLVPLLYRVARRDGKPMTVIVNGMIAEALEKMQDAPLHPPQNTSRQKGG